MDNKGDLGSVPITHKHKVPIVPRHYQYGADGDERAEGADVTANEQATIPREQIDQSDLNNEVQTNGDHAKPASYHSRIARLAWFASLFSPSLSSYLL